MSKRDFAPLRLWLSREEGIGSRIWLGLLALDKTSCKFAQGKGENNIWTQMWVRFTVVVTGPVSSTLLLVTFHWPVKKDFSDFRFSSAAQSCLTLCDPMDCSTPGFPVHHQFLELAETHVHRVSDAIQPSHRLLSTSPPASDLSQHQSFPVS